MRLLLLYSLYYIIDNFPTSLCCRYAAKKRYYYLLLLLLRRAYAKIWRERDGPRK